MSPQASPEPDMRVEVTDLGLTVGAIQEAAEVLFIDDLRSACEFALLQRWGARAQRTLPTTEEGLRETLINAVEFLRGEEPRKLNKLAEFVDGLVRTRFKEAQANSRRRASHSA